MLTPSKPEKLDRQRGGRAIQELSSSGSTSPPSPPSGPVMIGNGTGLTDFSRFLSPVGHTTPPMRTTVASGGLDTISTPSSLSEGSSNGTTLSTYSNSTPGNGDFGLRSGGGLPPAVPPAQSGLDQPHLLHAFYRWSCKEFSEPAGASPAMPAPVVEPEDDQGRRGGGLRDAVGGSVSSSPMIGQQQQQQHGHGHEPLESQGYEGALQLYFKKRNTRVHQEAKVKNEGYTDRRTRRERVPVSVKWHFNLSGSRPV